MMVKHYQYETESELNNKPFEEGAMYFIKDTQRIYLDPIQTGSNTEDRIPISSDLIIVATSSELDSILSPIPGKMYFVLETSKYFINHGGVWYSSGGNPTPRAGLIYLHPGAELLDGFLWCDGASYLRTDYPELFAAIGVMHGAVDDDHFNVPNLCTRVPVGAVRDEDIGNTADGGSAVDDADYIIFENMTGQDNDDSTISGVNTIAVNYIIATGRGAPVADISEIISGMQALPLGVEFGGTGGTTPIAARTNIGAMGREEMTEAIEGKIEELGLASTTDIETALENYAPPTLNEHLQNETMVLSDKQLGTEFPANPVEGQVFFKIINT